MTGGLLNLVSYGQESLLLYGNPQKTLFKTTYKQITNFGLQKFRIDHEGSRTLRMSSETKMDFRIPRYADLLHDSYIVLNIPNIWSPLYIDMSGEYIEYGFKWIEELGTTMIKEIEIHAGGNTLSKYSGEYLSSIVHRDFSTEKKTLWNKMIGNVPELNDPANAYTRTNIYPNAYNDGTTNNVRPSIYGRKLYIPLMSWFANNSTTSLPLTSLQYVEIIISITFRPIRELYIIRDVKDSTFNYPYIAPNINVDYQQFNNFLNPPEDPSGNVTNPSDNWNADIHLLSTYIFLDKNEQMFFAKSPQKYLIKDIFTWEYSNVAGSFKIDLDSRGLVSNYMFRFRRSDTYLRNTWSNYSNWPYNTLPYEVDNTTSPDPYLFITGNYNTQTEMQNYKGILLDMAILLDGKYRETTLHSGIYDYIEKYSHTTGGGKDGLYIYSFALHTDNHVIQPSGAMNMDKFDKIQFEINTLEPPINQNVNAITNICDDDGNVIGTRKNIWDLNEYNYDLIIFEERYNVIHIENGMIGLQYAR